VDDHGQFHDHESARESEVDTPTPVRSPERTVTVQPGAAEVRLEHRISAAYGPETAKQET
jgi:hypothetical protein